VPLDGRDGGGDGNDDDDSGDFASPPLSGRKGGAPFAASSAPSFAPSSAAARRSSSLVAAEAGTGAGSVEGGRSPEPCALVKGGLVLNASTGKTIKINGAKFNELLLNGHTLDLASGLLSPPETRDAILDGGGDGDDDAEAAAAAETAAAAVSPYARKMARARGGGEAADMTAEGGQRPKRSRP